jgi:hypothetical protein
VAAGAAVWEGLGGALLLLLLLLLRRRRRPCGSDGSERDAFCAF